MRNGFSVLEMLASLAIVTIIGYAMLSALTNQQKAQNTIMRNMQFNEVTAEIGMYLGSPEPCAKFLKDLLFKLPIGAMAPYAFQPAEKIRVAKVVYAGVTLAEVGVTHNGLTTKVSEFDRIIRNNIPKNGANERFILGYTFAVDKIGENYASQEKSKTWEVYLEVDPSGKVVYCSDTTFSPVAKCFQQGGVYDMNTVPNCIY